MACVGLVILGCNMAKSKNSIINKDFFVILALSLCVSLVGFISITLNNTPDTTYATYIASMCVWLSAALVVISLIRTAHGYVSVELVCNYIITVCAAQCVLALMIEHNANLKIVVDQYIEQGQDFLNKSNVKRWYGIGANLDVAGTRFAAALIMISCILLSNNDINSHTKTFLYTFAFLLIAIIGNMIARTTTVGLFLALVPCLLKVNWYNLKFSGNAKRFFRWLAVLLVAFIPLLIFLYKTDDIIHKNLRFAFEGFFSLAEKGEWIVTSNDKLKTMYVFPESLKTWIIGDGYFASPRGTDPYFIGKIVGGYYMGTDVGYLRFIFYFGLVGLTTFILFFIRVTSICVRRFREYKIMFLLFLLSNFIIWFKVSTDIFLVFALFFLIDERENTEYNESILLKA